MHRFEFATLEWLWDSGAIRINLPGGEERKSEGSYAEIVATLTALGQEGWDVANATAAANWVFWTLRRTLD